LRRWVREAEIDQGRRAGIISKELERENRELTRANEIILHRGSATTMSFEKRSGGSGRPTTRSTAWSSGSSPQPARISCG
jgi:hypothetical protein